MELKQKKLRNVRLGVTILARSFSFVCLENWKTRRNCTWHRMCDSFFFSSFLSETYFVTINGQGELRLRYGKKHMQVFMQCVRYCGPTLIKAEASRQKFGKTLKYQCFISVLPSTQFMAQIYHTFRPDGAIFRYIGFYNRLFSFCYSPHTGHCLHIGSALYVWSLYATLL
jgi:hypothetical protein